MQLLSATLGRTNQRLLLYVMQVLRIFECTHSNFIMAEKKQSCIDCMAPFLLSMINLIPFNKTYLRQFSFDIALLALSQLMQPFLKISLVNETALMISAYAGLQCLQMPKNKKYWQLTAHATQPCLTAMNSQTLPTAT